jgi:protein NrfD
MIEEILVTVRANPKVDPVLAIWSWEIPVYLFIGGLTAGIMFFAGLMILLGKESQAPFATRRLPLWAPIVLSVGMGALFLDLEHKLYVWRFYTVFQPASPMSWGSWVLLLVYPASVLLILTYLEQGWPTLHRWLSKLPMLPRLIRLSIRWRRGIAWMNLVLAVFLGIYTGILLSAFSARPFWNSGVLGPLFLVSGLSTAAALAVLGARQESERHLFLRIDMGLIVVELVLIALWLINLATGSREHLEALATLMGGEHAVRFWVWFVFLGLVTPLLLETRELLRRERAVRALAVISPLLVLGGGYLLRQIAVEVGQETTWVQYSEQFNTELLDRLRAD